MQAVGIFILLVTVAFSSVLPDRAALRQSSPSHSVRVPWEGLAIVVNRSNPTTDLTMAQLRAMFFGDRKWWSHRRRITLAAMRRSTPEGQTVLRVIYQMDGHELDRYFLYQAFKGENSRTPRTLPASADVKKFVVSTPGAVGYLRESEVDDSVKVVRINGLLPGDDGYPLRLPVRHAK